MQTSKRTQNPPISSEEKIFNEMFEKLSKLFHPTSYNQQADTPPIVYQREEPIEKRITSYIISFTDIKTNK